MRDESVLQFVHAKPFVPFRIVMNSGKTYDVRHPETIAVGRDVCIYYHLPEPGKAFDRFEFVSLLLIERIERLDQTAAVKDGQQQ